MAFEYVMDIVLPIGRLEFAYKTVIAFKGAAEIEEDAAWVAVEVGAAVGDCEEEEGGGDDEDAETAREAKPYHGDEDWRMCRAARRISSRREQLATFAHAMDGNVEHADADRGGCLQGLARWNAQGIRGIEFFGSHRRPHHSPNHWSCHTHSKSCCNCSAFGGSGDSFNTLTMPGTKRAADTTEKGGLKKRRLGGEQVDAGTRVRQDIFTDSVLKKYTADYSSSTPYACLHLCFSERVD